MDIYEHERLSNITQWGDRSLHHYVWLFCIFQQQMNVSTSSSVVLFVRNDMDVTEHDRLHRSNITQWGDRSLHHYIWLFCIFQQHMNVSTNPTTALFVNEYETQSNITLSMFMLSFSFEISVPFWVLANLCSFIFLWFVNICVIIGDSLI
jgi:hypothetical protein